MITKKDWEEALKNSTTDLENAQKNLINISKAVMLVKHEIEFIKERIKDFNIEDEHTKRIKHKS